MDMQNGYANGIPGTKPIEYDQKVPSQEEKTTSPLLQRSADLKYIDAANDDEGNDSKTVDNYWNNGPTNSVHTNECKKVIDTLTVSYNKDGKRDEDAVSTNEGVKFFGLGDDDSICSSKPPQEPAPQIPDGGWGWVVVAASFLIATVADGLAFSYGLMHDQFVIYFDTSEAKTSLIGSLFISVPLIAGPVMSALVDRYGCKNMTIVGGIASTVGLVAASFSNSVEVLYVTYGLMAGLGMGLLYVTAVVSIAFWFEKRRNLAVGLGSCGVGFGTFIYSPLTTYLLEEYEWRGTLLLLAGTVLNVCVCGTVMRDPEWLILEQKQQKQLSKSKRTSSSMSISAKSAKSGGGESVYPGMEELKMLLKSGETPEYILTALVASIAKAEDLEAVTKRNADLSQQKVSSVINLPTFLRQSERVPAEVLDQLISNKRLYNIILQNYPSMLALKCNSEHKLPTESVSSEASKSKPITMAMKLKLSKKKKQDFDSKLEVARQKLLHPIPENNKAAVGARYHRPDWISRQFTDHHYLRDIRVHRNSIMHRGAMMNIAKYKLRASSCPDIYKNSMWSMEDQESKTWGRRVIDMLNNTFDFNMFTEFHFLMMNLSTLVLFVWFIVPYFYIANFMKMNGYSEFHGSLMLSVFGVATIIGIVGLGWIGDLPCVNVTKTYAMCLACCGASIALFPVLLAALDPAAPASVYVLALNATVFGLTFSSSYSYTPSILVELIALDRFTMAYGLVLLSQGLGHLIGPPIAGALRDVTGSWAAAFYAAGAMVAAAGALVAVIPYTDNFRLSGAAPPRAAPPARSHPADVHHNIEIVIGH